MADNTTDCVNSLKFFYFCKLCEKIQAQKIAKRKGEILEKFVSGIIERNPASFFPILRMLLPQLDRERGPYGMKESNLARTYTRILCLPKTSSEAARLINFASPKYMTTGATGDFAEVVSCILRNRCGNGNEMTLGEVNAALDNIALKHASHDPRGVDDEFTNMVQKMSNFEQKWLIRIIMKEVNLGLGQKKILTIYHPDAFEVYTLSNSICQVCTRLKNRKTRYYELEIELFQTFRPMLCERGDVHNLALNGISYVETKMDGERFQIHYKDGKFKYFSRNGYEYTDTYGEFPDSGTLSLRIKNQLSPDSKSFILDGEMMGWHRERKKLVTKAHNIDVKNLKVGSFIQPCFCAFDVVHYNDTIMTSKPFNERIEILKKVFTPLEGVLMHVSRTTITSVEGAFDALNVAIDNNEEGIIIKKPTSVYIPNSRKDGWMKIKPDYSEGTVDLDLLIIGGYYGIGRKKGQIRHFMVGVASGSDSRDNPEQFMSIARVSSGLNDQELEELSEKLAQHWVKGKNHIPPNLLLKKEKPDVYIKPCNSVILQVKSPEVVRSDLYYTGYTLRFVRVDCVRYDKLWSDCLRIEEFERLRMSAEGKLTAGHVSSHKRKRKIESTENQSCTLVKVEKVSDIFNNKEISIISGNEEHPKDELEKLVRMHGGSVACQPSSQTFCIVYGVRNIKVCNLISAKKHNITTHEWLLECISDRKIIPWSRLNVVSTDLKTEIAIAENYDIFGDSYCEETTSEKLKALFKQKIFEDIPSSSNEEIAEMDQLLFLGDSPYSFFRDHYAYFDLFDCGEVGRPLVKAAELMFKFYGGNVCDCLTKLVSYIIFDERQPGKASRLKAIREEKNIQCKLLSYRWVMDSFKKKKLKSMESYFL